MESKQISLKIKPETKTRIEEAVKKINRINEIELYNTNNFIVHAIIKELKHVEGIEEDINEDK